MAKSLEKNIEVPEKVAIFWDYENCAPSNNVSGYTLVAVNQLHCISIVSSLIPRDQQRIRQIALKFGHITSFRAYLEFSDTSPKSVNLRSELQTSSVSLIDCPHSGRKDVADKMMIVDMLAFAIDNPSPATVILISGDRDFAYAVSTLQNRGYSVILFAPTASHIALKAQATQIFDWFDTAPVAVPDPNVSPKQSTNPMHHERESSSSSTFMYPSTSSSPRIIPAADEPAITPVSPAGIPNDRIPPQIIPSSPFPPTAQSPAPVKTDPSTVPLQRPNSVPLPPVFSTPKSPAQGNSAKFPASPYWTLSGKPLVVRPQFEILLNLLEGYRKAGITAPLRSHVGEALLHMDKQIYAKAGVSKFKEYITMVAAAGLVRLGVSVVQSLSLCLRSETFDR